MPTAIGIIVQGLFYGVSTIWPCLAISICAMFIGLQNEIVYTDSLTGLYNRLYLDTVKQDIMNKKNSDIYAMMLDLNAFKSINDTYGHSEGDFALIKVAEILRKSVGNLGSVIRFAGDEFVILLNTRKEEVAQGCIHAIRENTDEYNKKSGKEYKLSLSIGYRVLDMKKQTIDTLLHDIDEDMYMDKQKFYSENPEYKRRNG